MMDEGKESRIQAALVGILVGNLLHVSFPSWFGHAWLCMLVYGSLDVSGMVFSLALPFLVAMVFGFLFQF